MKSYKSSRCLRPLCHQLKSSSRCLWNKYFKMWIWTKYQKKRQSKSEYSTWTWTQSTSTLHWEVRMSKRDAYTEMTSREFLMRQLRYLPSKSYTQKKKPNKWSGKTFQSFKIIPLPRIPKTNYLKCQVSVVWRLDRTSLRAEFQLIRCLNRSIRISKTRSEPFIRKHQ